MSIHSKIPDIIIEVSDIKFSPKLTTTNNLISELKRSKQRTKETTAINIEYSLRKIIRSYQEKNRSIAIAILGISEIEFKEVICRTRSISKKVNWYYFLDKDEYLLKKFRLHSNSIKMICDIFDITINE